jgi:branched-chain amino acid transport system permease protein
VLATGLALFELTRRQFSADWERIQEEIEKEIKRREALL